MNNKKIKQLLLREDLVCNLNKKPNPFLLFNELICGFNRTAFILKKQLNNEKKFVIR